MKGATPKQLPHAKVVQKNRPLAGVIQPSRGAPQHRRDVEGEFTLIEFNSEVAPGSNVLGCHAGEAGKGQMVGPPRRGGQLLAARSEKRGGGGKKSEVDAGKVA